MSESKGGLLTEVRFRFRQMRNQTADWMNRYKCRTSIESSMGYCYRNKGQEALRQAEQIRNEEGHPINNTPGKSQEIKKQPSKIALTHTGCMIPKTMQTCPMPPAHSDPPAAFTAALRLFIALLISPKS